MLELLFRCGDAARIFAKDNIGQCFRHLDTLLFHELTVADDVDADTRIHIADDIQTYGDIGVDLDDVLFAQLFTVDVLDNGHGTVKFFKTKQFIEPHTPSVSAMRMYLP